jgi:hypothetical protein
LISLEYANVVPCFSREKVVIKPIYGAAGEGIIFVTDVQALREFILFFLSV